MAKNRPPQVIQNTPAVTESDDHCPVCNSTNIKQTGEIRLDCDGCGFWWNEYSLVGDDDVSADPS